MLVCFVVTMSSTTYEQYIPWDFLYAGTIRHFVVLMLMLWHREMLMTHQETNKLSCTKQGSNSVPPNWGSDNKNLQTNMNT